MVKGLGIRPNPDAVRKEFTYYPGIGRIPDSVAPNVRNHSFTIDATVDIPDKGAEGVLVAHGNRFGGYSLYVLKGKLVFTYNYADLKRFTVVANGRLPAGKHVLEMAFAAEPGYGKGGVAALSVDGKKVGEGKIEQTLGNRYSLDATFEVGEASGSAVTDDYKVPFRFTGELEKVVVTVR